MIEKTNILNGNRKNEIVTEWLKKIDIQVVKLLRTKYENIPLLSSILLPFLLPFKTLTYFIHPKWV